jgi:hypothetical protein
MPTPAYLSLFHRHVAFSFDKQLQLADLIGELNWSFNKPSGVLSFGDRFQWHVEILGTEAYDQDTWLWAWANQGSNIPAKLLEGSLTMKALGEEQRISELVTPELSLGDLNGHMLCLIASGVCQANAYYRGPYTGGAAFFMIKDAKFPKPDVVPLARILSVFPQLISALEIPNHRLAFMGYLEDYGLVGKDEGSTIVVRENDKELMTATFNERNLLTELEGTISPIG